VDTQKDRNGNSTNGSARGVAPKSQSIEWYVEGEEREVDFAGVRVTVRFVGRKGRRARIAITAPGGAAFSARI